jgi:broad specificity phosphatase PhoE
MPVTQLSLVRHGQSTGNAAHDAAIANGAEVVDVGERDADAPLTELGREQARALGGWLADQPGVAATWCSPYVRARLTADIVLSTAGRNPSYRIDERLRDREPGVLDGLTSRGVTARWPDERERYLRLGKLYYRPPGGESWADVALRVRSVLQEILAGEEHVLVVCHDAVVMLVRYVLECWDERTLLDTLAATDLANGSVTRLTRQADGHWSADLFNHVPRLV